MSGQIVGRLKPEEEEILRKREELALLHAQLAERELELVDLKSQLAAFEGLYLRQVGTLYAELDEWKAKIAELIANRDQSEAAQDEAQQARNQAHQTYQDAHGDASKVPEFVPSPEFKKLYRDVAKLIHPDFSKNAEDLKRRTRFMAQANLAYENGDAEELERIMNEYKDGSDSRADEGPGAELIRIIRQISLAKNRIAAIAIEIEALRQSEIALLKRQAEESKEKGVDLLTQLADAVRTGIETARSEFNELSARAT